MDFKKVFIDRKSYKTYENGIKSQKYLLFFTFSKAAVWLGSSAGQFWPSGYMFDTPPKTFRLCLKVIKRKHLH